MWRTISGQREGILIYFLHAPLRSEDMAFHCHGCDGIRYRTYKQLVAEGEQQLDAVHLLISLERKPKLKVQNVQLSIAVLVFFSHLQGAELIEKGFG